MDIAVIQQGITAADRPSAGAGNAGDSCRLTVCILLISDVPADLVSIGIVDLRCERAVVGHRIRSCCRNVHSAFDALDYTASSVDQSVMGRCDLGVIRMLICLYVGSAADLVDDSVVCQRIGIACGGACIFGIDLAVDDLTD